MPRLVIKQGKGVGRDHALGAAPCVVGRDAASAQFVLDDHLVSRRHFQVLQDDGTWYVEDLGSTNGTLLNGTKAKRGRLTDGDTIRAGETDLTFVQKDLLGGASAPVPARRRMKDQGGAPRRGGAPVRRKRRR